MTGSVLSLDDNVGITTEGDASHGLLAQRGIIEAGDGLNISVEGSGSHGAYVNAATGSIEFLGGATIDNNDNDGYAIYADKGTITGTAGNSTLILPAICMLTTAVPLIWTWIIILCLLAVPHLQTAERLI